jgi:hypothetical protein
MQHEEALDLLQVVADAVADFRQQEFALAQQLARRVPPAGQPLAVCSHPANAFRLCTGQIMNEEAPGTYPAQQQRQHAGPDEPADEGADYYDRQDGDERIAWKTSTKTRRLPSAAIVMITAATQARTRLHGSIAVALTACA